jgi:hypothetical protein
MGHITLEDDNELIVMWGEVAVVYFQAALNSFRPPFRLYRWITLITNKRGFIKFDINRF